ncbi:hypothetical protein F4778DRAFT_721595 [Xylariomycetidae sp. FL2044]|nr:hypothetical protein F4778DRAFT_721595 [Xylariomycetidae sp. FL2044]
MNPGPAGPALSLPLSSPNPTFYFLLSLSLSLHILSALVPSPVIKRPGVLPCPLEPQDSPFIGRRGVEAPDMLIYPMKFVTEYEVPVPCSLDDDDVHML